MLWGAKGEKRFPFFLLPQKQQARKMLLWCEQGLSHAELD